MKINATARVEEMTVAMVITRCGCDAPLSHPDEPCPTPRGVEDLGIVARYRPRRGLLRWFQRR